MNSRDRFSIGENGHLCLHGIDLVDISDKYGTPLFVFDEDRVRENYMRFRQAFARHYPRTIVCYSVKTNNNLAICNILQQVGTYAEVCSELDLYTAVKAGFDPKHIVLDGSYKPEGLLREALNKRIAMINVESITELVRLDGIAGELDLDQAIGLRIGLQRPRSFRPSLSGPRLFKHDPSSRFGFSMEEAYKILRQATKFENLQVKGIMTHPYNGAAEMLLPFVKRIHGELKINIDHVNLGGGFNPGIDIEKVGRSVTDLVKKILNHVEPTIVLEPGSFIVGDAGLLLLRVDHVKEAAGFKWVTVDGGTNLLPMSNGHYEVRVANRNCEPPSELANIVGPIPSPIDSICLKKRLPRIREGDIIAVLDCGAYSLSSSNQFLYPRPSVVMLTLDKAPVEIRKPETFEYVTQLDRTLDQGV